MDDIESLDRPIRQLMECIAKGILADAAKRQRYIRASCIGERRGGAQGDWQVYIITQGMFTSLARKKAPYSKWAKVAPNTKLLDSMYRGASIIAAHHE